MSKVGELFPKRPVFFQAKLLRFPPTARRAYLARAAGGIRWSFRSVLELRRGAGGFVRVGCFTEL